jgi:hypothetical protein
MPNPALTLSAYQLGTTNEETLIQGKVAEPVPASFNDSLWVVLPAFSTDRPFGPCEWGAIHGATLPALGAKVVLILDDEDDPHVISWQGEHS